MQNVNVATTSTTILAAGARGGKAVFIQNHSDTDIMLSLDADNDASLTATVGYKLHKRTGELFLTGPAANNKITGIHGGSGNKVVHYQIFKNS